jgi:hypothetical protein
VFDRTVTAVSRWRGLCDWSQTAEISRVMAGVGIFVMRPPYNFKDCPVMQEETQVVGCRTAGLRDCMLARIDYDPINRRKSAQEVRRVKGDGLPLEGVLGVGGECLSPWGPSPSFLRIYRPTHYHPRGRRHHRANNVEVC